MVERSDRGSLAAAADFERARVAADLERLVARLTHRPADLLPYEEVRDKVRARTTKPLRLETVPLEAIVGSVDRYLDFTRQFLPRRDDDQVRWARVMEGATGMTGLPPIEVYQIGEAFFVRDGNHRVSVARHLGAETIEAYVTEVESRVPITPETRINDLIVKAEYADFLERVPIDLLRPGADLGISAPGRYPILEEHIAVHRYYMGIEQGREIPIEEAITHWYDTVYLPVARVIQDRGLLLEFPRRTEADLYLWAMDHLSHLQEAVGWDLDPTEAADRLALLFSQRPERIVTRIRERLLDAVTPDSLEGGPPPGYWRREWLEPGGYEALFRHILVPVSGEESGWAALDQAIEVARREGGSLRGLHVTAASDQETSARAKAIQDRFAERCREGGIPGKLVLETGQIARTICDRSRWAGLVVVHLAHPPGDTPLARLGSGMRTLLLRCARPVLVVPRVRPLDSALLAYDGSRKAGEALFVAAHLADRWQIPLSVLTVDEGNQADDRQAGARAYIESRGVEASFLRDSVRPARAILTAAEEQGCNLLIMGGYGHTPLLETLLGSTVDQVLRAGDRPVLICR